MTARGALNTVSENFGEKIFAEPVAGGVSKVVRCISNPIIKPQDVKPTNKDYEVVGVFNPGVTTYKGKTLLLLRIAQRPKDKNDGYLRVPVYNENTGEMEIVKFDKSDKSIDFSDSRVVILGNGKRYLTSVSFFRIATSEDGEHFTIDQDHAIVADNGYEAFGIEDPRITKINENYYIDYSSASEYGIVTRLMVTKDFKIFQKLGNMMYPDNKDVSIFPEKIGGKYYTLHRPSTSEFGKPEIWIAESPDLKCWGNHRRVMATRSGRWDSTRIGSSSVPIRTKKGWLVIYHGADENNRYCLGCCLLDLNDPGKLIARSEKPFLEPKEMYEKIGFFGDVVFSCGCVQRGDVLDIYYGAVDTYICKATTTISDLLEILENN